MGYRIQEEVLNHYGESGTDVFVEEYMKLYNDYLATLSVYDRMKEIKSGYNRMNRTDLWSSEEMNLTVYPGDVCYLDFGQAYKNESGFQHFGLVMKVTNLKILVVPMTSKYSARKFARNLSKEGKPHLYYIGHIEGLTKCSTLFLNDFKYLNSSRIISVNGRLSTRSSEFKEIQSILKNEMM